MKKLNTLKQDCISYSILYNPHKVNYLTAKEYIDELLGMEDVTMVATPKEIREKMAMMDSIFYVQAHPNTPIGFTDVFHFSLEEALAIVSKEVEEYQNDNQNTKTKNE